MKQKSKKYNISKVYRLKPSAHSLIIKIQKLIRCTQGEAIGFACRKYYMDLMSERKK